MALTLPIHDLRMDEPAPSEVFEYDNQTFYCWLLSETERAHVASMLNMEGKQSSGFRCPTSQKETWLT